MNWVSDQEVTAGSDYMYIYYKYLCICECIMLSLFRFLPINVYNMLFSFMWFKRKHYSNSLKNVQV